LRRAKAFGFGAPVLVDDTLILIGGYGRLKAAELLNIAEIPAVQLLGLSEAQKRALALADNKSGDNAGWDRARLAIELPDLAELLIKENLDISVTGFSPAEIDQLQVDPWYRSAFPSTRIGPFKNSETEIDHFYVGPAAAKTKKAALDAKLAAGRLLIHTLEIPLGACHGRIFAAFQARVAGQSGHVRSTSAARNEISMRANSFTLNMQNVPSFARGNFRSSPSMRPRSTPFAECKQRI
jgi:hypothetical protein